MLTIFALLATLLTADTIEGLKPFEPPAGTQISKELRSGSSDKSLILREIQPTDKLKYLRSQEDWYEVELTSAEGFIFHGWVHGALPVERTMSLAPTPLGTASNPKAAIPNPLESSKYLWFWTGKLSEKAFLSLDFGLQNINYALEGTYTTGSLTGQRGKIYTFSAPGFALNFAGGFPLFEIPLKKDSDKKFYIDFLFQYSYGISSVSFSSQFAIPELQGASYAVYSHLYDIKAVGKFVFPLKGGARFEAGGGLGFLYYEILPELRAVSGGQFDGEVVVGDSSFSGVGIPLVASLRNYKKFNFNLVLTPYLFATDISEDVYANKYSSNLGLFAPIQVQFLTSYEIAPHWDIDADIRYLNVQGNGESGTRLKNPYDGGQITLSTIQALVGFKYTF